MREIRIKKVCPAEISLTEVLPLCQDARSLHAGVTRPCAVDRVNCG
jgi:hypothetical protein